MSADGQGTKRGKNAEIFNRLSMVHLRYQREFTSRSVEWGEVACLLYAANYDVSQ